MQAAETRKAEEEARRKEEQQRQKHQHELQQQLHRTAAVAAAALRALTSPLAELPPPPSISRVQRSALSTDGDADLEDGEIEKVPI